MSDQVSDKLIEISSSKWSILRDMYLRDWPLHMVGYYTMDNYVRWNKIKSGIRHLHIYSLNGDWQSDGMFIVVDRYQVFLNSLNNDSIERIFRALILLDWKYGLIVCSFLIRHRPAVLKAVHSKQLIAMSEEKCSLYYMSRAEAANLEVVCPEGISLRPMLQEHATIANELWPHSRPGSLFYLKRLIDWNLNVGAFTDDGKLVAWCFRSPSGPLTAIQVVSSHIRRGLGTLVTINMTKKLSELDMDSYAVVAHENVESRCMFEKIGFKVVDYCYYLGTEPLVVSDWNEWDSN